VNRVNSYNSLHNVLFIYFFKDLIFLSLHFSDLLKICCIKLFVLFISFSSSIQPFIIRELLCLAYAVNTLSTVSRSIICKPTPLMLPTICNKENVVALKIVLDVFNAACQLWSSVVVVVLVLMLLTRHVSLNLCLSETVRHYSMHFFLHYIEALDVLNRYSLSCVPYLSDAELHPVQVLPELLYILFVGDLDLLK